MRPSDCPKFSHCSAPVCPLDFGHLGTAHIAGERVCFFLLAAAKADLPPALAVHPTLVEARCHVSAITATFPAIRRVLRRAARTPLRQGPSRPIAGGTSDFEVVRRGREVRP